jgi:hypothetical protein
MHCETNMKKIWVMIKEILLDKKVVLSGSLLLLVVFVDFFFLQTISSELDILEHFLFGFVLSQLTSNFVRITGLDRRLIRWSNERISASQGDLFLRLLGFLFIGGVLWEGSERFLLPTFGVPYNPFFTFPVTLHNIDGVLDVSVGILGSIVSWYTTKQQLVRKPIGTQGCLFPNFFGLSPDKPSFFFCHIFMRTVGAFGWILESSFASTFLLKKA